jgi:hypothetical protein
LITPQSQIEGHKTGTCLVIIINQMFSVVMIGLNNKNTKDPKSLTRLTAKPQISPLRATQNKF